MSIRIALAGNPNSGKTTFFNAITGSNQYVGNWPGVTVEKKEGKIKNHKEITLVDLPGIYSLSPYTLEEVVARDFLLGQSPDAVINIVDGSNIERNLYLTTQLLEIGIPVVMALNMIDIVTKSGDKIDIKRLSAELGCEVVETSAIKGTGLTEVVDSAIALVKEKKANTVKKIFSQTVENVISQIEETLSVDRWHAIKIFERDEKITASNQNAGKAENIIKSVEEKEDDDSESIITNERYTYITGVLKNSFSSDRKGKTTVSDKIDKIVTNRWLALPIFAAIMFLVYYIAVTTVGDILTGWANDGLFGDSWSLFGLEIPGIPILVGEFLDAINCSEILSGLILDGIIGGVGAVLGFVPQIMVLFILLALLEECGYMARVAFIMDRIFRKFGLSGKSFIPILIGTGCGIPGIMASRTIENDRDRRMTIMTTTFIPCGAKLPIIALIAGALFDGEWWVAPSAYFVGIIAIVMSGIILKKTKMFTGNPAPFVMELPKYHVPTVKSVARSVGERSWSFIKKAGTIILISSIGIWIFSSFGFTDGSFGMVEMEESMLAKIGSFIAPIFAPLGFGNWQATVATVMGLVAKEEVVGVFGVLFGISGDALELIEAGDFDSLQAIAGAFTTLTAYTFLLFNLLCAPCFAAIGAIRREMSSAKWTWFAIGYQTGFAYAVALIVYQLGNLFVNGSFGVGTVIAILLLAGFGYLLFRRDPMKNKKQLSMERRSIDV